MGLDIRYYAGLQPSDQGTIDEGTDVVDANGQYTPNLICFYPNDPWYQQWNNTWPPNQIFSFLLNQSFRAGSYTGYSQWRWWLESLVLEAQEVPEPGDPFYELLIFSDCEGTIDETISCKLLRDFMMYDHKARTSCPQRPWLYEVYQDFTNAFRIASVQGAVVFC